MNKWLLRGLIALVLVLALAGGAYWWFLAESGTPKSTYAFDLAEVRRLANSLPGDKPVAIHAEHVAPFSFMGNVVVAGDGFAQVPMMIFAYKLDFPKGETALIDSGVTARSAAIMKVKLDTDAAQHIVAALKFASFTVYTHEHMDHLGGLLGSPWVKLEIPRAIITTEQFAHLAENNENFHADFFDGYKPLAYDKYRAIAPGVVLIKAPGHTPGSQMVFVQLANGQEFLFIGDVAWTMRNIDTMRERARLATQFFLNEDRDAVLAELVTLNALKKANPKLHIVPGHDIGAVEALEQAGLITKGFHEKAADSPVYLFK